MKHKAIDKIRVIFLLNSLAGGGAERVVLELLQNLERSQFQAFIALLSLQGDYFHLVPADAPIIDLSAYRGKVNMLRRTWRLKQLVDEVQPHIIVAGLTSPNAALLRAAPLIRHQCRLVVTVHNHLSVNLRRQYHGVAHFAKTLETNYLYPWADRIIAVSQGVKSDLIQNFGLDKSRIKTIYNPVNLRNVQIASSESVELPWPSSDRRQTLVTVGRLITSKGYDDLINAFAIIRRQIASRLIILGQGELRTQLMTMVRDLDLQDDVYMPGFVQNPWAYMQKADLYVSASRSEGFPLTLLEAMACGMPVIATDCDFGPREIFETGTNGILVPVSDVNAIAANAIDLLSNDAKRKALGQAGCERARDFDVPIITKQYEDLFCELA